jgi:ornithine cyclodeaminase
LRVKSSRCQLTFSSPSCGEVICGTKAGRLSQESITIFDSVGFAIEDFSALRLMYDIAEKLNLGKPIDLVPQPENPRDLYRLLCNPE